MDRNIVYPGGIPLDTDLLLINKNAMVGLGYLAQAVLGQSTVADGLVCPPTSPASMTVTVGPGSLTQLTALDTLSYGSLPADPTDALVKMGNQHISDELFIGRSDDVGTVRQLSHRSLIPRE